MSDKDVKVSFDVQGAMRSLGRMTRKGIETVKEKTGVGEEERDDGSRQDSGRKSGE